MVILLEIFGVISGHHVAVALMIRLNDDGDFKLAVCGPRRQ